MCVLSLEFLRILIISLTYRQILEVCVRVSLSLPLELVRVYQKVCLRWFEVPVVINLGPFLTYSCLLLDKVSPFLYTFRPVLQHLV